MLSAGDFVGLQRKMLLNNIAKGKWFKYFDIQKIDNQWCAFYFAPVETDLDVKILSGKKGKR